MTTASPSERNQTRERERKIEICIEIEFFPYRSEGKRTQCTMGLLIPFSQNWRIHLEAFCLDFLYRKPAYRLFYFLIGKTKLKLNQILDPFFLTLCFRV